ncbi:disulfide bond formation protein B [Roseovarius spongiae]
MAGSAALLLGAFAFQHLGGLPPCKLCLWQRWPHAAALLIGAAALMTRGAALPLLGALAALATAGVGAYHTGVERGWWEGPASCSGGGAGLDPGSLLSMDAPTNVVMCDEVAWQMAGLSMASWNMLASLALAVLWVMAARRA